MNTLIDLTGAMLWLISGYFYIKEKPVAWLISLMAIPCDATMDIIIGVYGDLVLQFIYFILLIYGWYVWRYGNEAEDNLPILRMSMKQFYFYSVMSGIIVTLIWMGLNKFTDSQIPLLDATVTCLSLVAQWLMCRKILESWILWIFVDVIYIVIYADKFMTFHGLMSFVDACVCVVGYIYWVREYRGLKPVTQVAVVPAAFDEAIPQPE